MTKISPLLDSQQSPLFTTQQPSLRGCTSLETLHRTEPYQVGVFFGTLIPAITLAIFSSKVSTLSNGFAAEDELLDGGKIVEADKAPTDFDCESPLGRIEEASAAHEGGS
jgi:hypothetical protein